MSDTSNADVDAFQWTREMRWVVSPVTTTAPVTAAVEGHVRTESLGAIHLRGFRRPRLVFRIRELASLLPAVPDRLG